MLTALQKIKKIYTDTVVWVAGAICMVILVINVANVVIRYATNASFIYTEDVTVMGMLWILGLGISVGWWNREHLLINIIDELLPPKALEILFFCLDLIGLAAGILMYKLGSMTASINVGLKTSLIGFDESLRYWPVIAGGALLAFAAACCIVEQILKWVKKGDAQA